MQHDATAHSFAFSHFVYSIDVEQPSWAGESRTRRFQSPWSDFTIMRTSKPGWLCGSVAGFSFKRNNIEYFMLEPCWICTEHEIETWCKDSAIDLAVSHSNQFQLPLNSQPLSASFQRNTLSFRLHRPLWDSAPFDRSPGIYHVYNSSSIANG